MREIQIRALKKRTLSKKLMYFINKDKQAGGPAEPIRARANQLHPKSYSYSYSKLSLFRDTPEKLLDFPSIFNQNDARELSHPFLEKVNAQNLISRRKKIQHHEETYPLFSRI